MKIPPVEPSLRTKARLKRAKAYLEKDIEQTRQEDRERAERLKYRDGVVGKIIDRSV